MRLTVTLPELEKGYSLQHGPKERILELGFMAERKEPVAIVPVSDHDYRIISAVLLTEAVGIKETSVKILFRPIWCRIFTLWSNTHDKLSALVCQFSDQQIWVDDAGWRPCRMTLNGDGTDPKAVRESEYKLGELLIERPRPWILGTLSDLIQKHC
jgi:hypothetical protein